MRTVLWAVVYYLVLTPVAAVVRAVRDPLRRRRDPTAETYWTFGGVSTGDADGG